MNRLAFLIIVIVLYGCVTPPPVLTVWHKDGATEQQAMAALTECDKLTSRVMSVVSKGLDSDEFSSGSSVYYEATKYGSFANTPTNQKIVRQHCMAKKGYRYVPKKQR